MEFNEIRFLRWYENRDSYFFIHSFLYQIHTVQLVVVCSDMYTYENCFYELAATGIHPSLLDL
jgi:hypothetical protein